jgi:hypothetical protein
VTLQDLENATLLALGQPSANPGGVPNWGGEFPQNQVDWAINRAYARLVSDLGDLELLTASQIFQTVAKKFSYGIATPRFESLTPPAVTITITPGFTEYQDITLTIGFLGNPSMGDFVYTTQPGDTPYDVMAAFIALINDSQITSNSFIPGLLQKVNLPVSYADWTYSSPIILRCYTRNQVDVTVSSNYLGVSPGLLTSRASLPAARMIRRVYYQSLGEVIRQELEPGARLVSWEEFNRRTGAGYLLANSAGTTPDFCAVNPARSLLYFYPAPAQDGDLVTVEYCPIVTNDAKIPASAWGYLRLPTDVPPLPEDAQDAIWEGAVSFLMPKAREYEGGRAYGEIYKAEVQRIKDNYTRDSAGDALILRPAEDALSTSGTNSFMDLGG